MTEDGEAFERVLAAVRERVEPDSEERERLAAVAATIVERARTAVADLPVEADVIQVGSTARGTWISGDRDVDVFVRFPPDIDRQRLERYGLAVGHEVLPDGTEEYAEHPYVTGRYDGFDVDLVPCYRVASATDIRSAVDRTPFHTQYLDRRLDDDLAREVRLAKQFCKGVGVYGSDLRTEGFSGYLVELLVLEHGGFRQLLAAAADWHPPVRFDPEDHGRASFDDPLVVIDPTDPERNVAAVLSTTNLARFQHSARDLLADPRIDLFERSQPAPLSAAAVREHLANRATTPVAIVFPAPDVVEDQLYPQLRKSLSGVADELDRRGFDVLRTATFADDGAGGEPADESDGGDRPSAGSGEAVLLVELSVAERPAVERHEGPPVQVREHARTFYETYADDPDAYGPFVDGDRYVVEREREFTSAVALLESDALFDVGLGTHVEDALTDDREVLVDGDVTDLCSTFGVELARYFDPEP